MSTITPAEPGAYPHVLTLLEHCVLLAALPSFQVQSINEREGKW